MDKRRKILVPIDFSQDSVNALEHAIRAANLIDSDLAMIFVEPAKNYKIEFNIEGDETLHSKNAGEYFELLVEKYKASFKSSGKFEYLIRKGVVYREICNQARYSDDFIIIMGTNGVSGFEEHFAGSTAYKVVSHAPCPVITIRLGYLKTGFSKIICPIDISPETRQKVPFIMQMAKIFNSEVHVVGVRETKRKTVIHKIDQYINQIYDYIKKHNIKVVKDHIYGDNISRMTIEYADKIDAELISIMTEQTENPYNLLIGTYAKQMVDHSPIPVLSIHNF